MLNYDYSNNAAHGPTWTAYRWVWTAVNTNRFATTVKPTSVMLTLGLHSQQKVSN